MTDSLRSPRCLSLLSSHKRGEHPKNQAGMAHLALPRRRPGASQGSGIPITNSEQTAVRPCPEAQRAFPISSAALQRTPEAQPSCAATVFLKMRVRGGKKKAAVGKKAGVTRESEAAAIAATSPCYGTRSAHSLCWETPRQHRPPAKSLF